MKDVLIVGFGLAGLSVARQLEMESRSFDVISDESQQSSKVAGGILNPVALKRYNLPWKASEFIPQAIKFYSGFNADNGKTFFNALPIYKLFSSAEDENNWVVASDQPKLEAFLSPEIQKLNLSLNDKTKAGKVRQSYLLHLKSLIQSEKHRYSVSSQFFSESFEHKRIEINSDKLSYNGKKYRFVVFCEGYGIENNPFFNWLPVYGNKGEYLIFRSRDLRASDLILKSRYFIIPLGDDLYKYGATYSRDHLNNDTTESARLELETKLKEMIGCDFEIINQLAGVRPTVRDRKPIVGAHPKFKNLFLLNGFGSRGIMAAPVLSRQLTDLIFKNKEIDEEVSPDRFLKFYA